MFINRMKVHELLDASLGTLVVADRYVLLFLSRSFQDYTEMEPRQVNALQQHPSETESDLHGFLLRPGDLLL